MLVAVLLAVLLAVANRRLALPLLCCFCVRLCFCFKLPCLLLFGCLCSFCQPSSHIPAAASWRCWWWRRPGKWPGWWTVAGSPVTATVPLQRLLLFCFWPSPLSPLKNFTSRPLFWFFSFLYSHSIFHRFKLPSPFSFQKPSLVQKTSPFMSVFLSSLCPPLGSLLSSV